MIKISFQRLTFTSVKKISDNWLKKECKQCLHKGVKLKLWTSQVKGILESNDYVSFQNAM